MTLDRPGVNMKKQSEEPMEPLYKRIGKRLVQLVWEGKYEEDKERLETTAPPCYTQEKIHPKVIAEDLRGNKGQDDLFEGFNGLLASGSRREHRDYEHSLNWSNRMILGDSLKVMASLVKKDGLRGQVQCIYMDPPYGIQFKSNFQATTKGAAGDAKKVVWDPSAVQAFRDTWQKGVHSYLSYLRDRFQAARELLAASGSIFFQISDENLHLCRFLLEEVFGKENYITTIKFKKASRSGSTTFMSDAYDYILWFAKDKERVRANHIYIDRVVGAWEEGHKHFRTPEGKFFPNGTPVREGWKPCVLKGATSADRSETGFDFSHEGTLYPEPINGHWKTSKEGMRRLQRSGRLHGGKTLSYVRHLDDSAVVQMEGVWSDTGAQSDKVYVVQTLPKAIQRCILMATEPGDLVLDPTCGSGTTAYVAEEWGRRWITIDTSKVAITLARARLMGAVFPCYLLADKEGRDVSKGLICEEVSHIGLKQIARNEKIDEIWEQHKGSVKSRLKDLNELLEEEWKDWDVPYDPSPEWSEERRAAHEAYWKARADRQRAMDREIAASAGSIIRQDRPKSDPNIVRVSGPFTMETLSPHRVLSPSSDDILGGRYRKKEREELLQFHKAVFANLKVSGIRFHETGEEVRFKDLTRNTGARVHLVGACLHDGRERRAAVFIGPQYGTITALDLEAAAEEAARFGSELLFACGFAFEAHAAGAKSERKDGLRVLRVHMNHDLRMADRLKGKKSDTLFVIVGEPEIEVRRAEPQDGKEMWEVEIKGISTFNVSTGEVSSGGTSAVECWLLDTNYNEESFFVQHAYFPGRREEKKHPYRDLKRALKAEISEQAWAALNRTVSRPFERPSSGKIAVKAINARGDEVLAVREVPPA